MTAGDLGDLGRIVVGGDAQVATAAVEGEIDLSNSDLFAEQLLQAVEHAAAGLVADLSRAGYIDSAGIRSLFAVQAHLAQRRQELVLVVPRTSLLRPVLEATGVPGAIPFHDELDSAVAAVRARYAAPPRTS